MKELITPNILKERKAWGWHSGRRMTSRGRVFPPIDDLPTFAHVIQGYEKLGWKDEASPAPWLTVMNEDEVLEATVNMQPLIAKFVAALGEFSEDTGQNTAQQLESAESFLEGLKDKAGSTETFNYQAAKHDAVNLLLHKTLSDNSFAFKQYQHHLKDLPPNITKLIQTGIRFLQFETFRGKEDFEKYPNPWGLMMDMYNMGMNDYNILGQETFTPSFLTQENSEELELPYHLYGSTTFYLSLTVPKK